MAQKKTNTERIKQLEEQVASLMGEKTEPTKSAKPKSTAAKKPATKKSTAGSTGAKKPAAKTGQTAKKTTAKKPAAKSQAKPKAVEPPVEEAEKTVEAADDIAVQPVAENQAAAEQPVEEVAATTAPEETNEPVADEVKPEPEPEKPEASNAPTDEAKTEEESVQPVAAPENQDDKAEIAESDGKDAEAAAAVDNAPSSDSDEKPEEPVKAEKGGKARAFADKANNFINNKGKLPIFIIANVLLVLSTVLLIVAAFNITTASLKTVSYNLFTYFGKSAEVKSHLALMAGSWGGGGYIMIGILMILAMLVPLALAVKNLVLCLVKKDKSIYMYDAIITFAFMLAYIGIINLYGANVTAGHIVAFVIATALVAFTTFAAFVANTGKALPIYSIVNIPLIIIAVFLLSATPTLTGTGGPYYGARAAGVCGNGGFSFIVLLVSVFALVLLSIMQLKKLPAVLEIIVPIVSAGCALLAALLFGAGRVAGTNVGAGLICGVIFDILLTVANVVFTLHPKLKRHKVQIKD